MCSAWEKNGVLEKEKKRGSFAKTVRDVYLLSTIVAGGIFLGGNASAIYHRCSSNRTSYGEQKQNHLIEAAKEQDWGNRGGLGLLLLASHWGAYLYGARRRHKR